MVHWKCWFLGLILLGCCIASLEANQRIRRDNGEGEGGEEGATEAPQEGGIEGEADPVPEDEATTPTPTPEEEIATTAAAATEEGAAAATEAAVAEDTGITATVDGTAVTEAGTADGTNTTGTDGEATTPSSDKCEKNMTAADLQEWKCRTPCTAKENCKNPKADCVCDGPCGMVCVPLDQKCVKPNPPENGKVETPDGIAYGVKIQYACDEGYELIGDTDRVCRGDQKWDGPEPFCTKAGVRCDTPTLEFPNATAQIASDKEEFYIDEEVIYACDDGFEFETFGTNYITCEENDDGTASWTNITISCLPVECEPPAALTNGSYTGENFTFGEQITYECDFGFDLIKGDAVHTCSADKTWEGKLPTCFLPDVKCPIPKDPEHGSVKFGERLFGHVVKYECEVGFKINGTEQRKCIEEGVWSDDDPTCEVVECGEPEPPRNGSIIFLSGTAYSKQVDYDCDTNSVPSGPLSATCGEDGEWTPAAPVCLSHCLIEDFQHAYMVPKTVTVYEQYNSIPLGIYLPHNTSAQTVCDEGFEVPNDESAVKAVSPVECQDGAWVPSADCQAARCFCEEIDFKILKERNLILTRDCEQPIASDEELQLKCDPNFPEAVEKGNLPCFEGKWVYPNSTDVRCRLRSCSVFDMRLEFGKIEKDQVEWMFDSAVDSGSMVPHDTELRFECTEENYELFVGGKAIHDPDSGENSTIRMCENGVWSGQMPVCKPGRCQCDELRANKSDSVEIVECVEFTLSGEYAQLQCAPGHSDPVGSLFIQCVNREWQSPNTECKEMCSCMELEGGLNASVRAKECGDFARSGKPVTLECASGFVNFTGTTEVTCEDGNWTLDTTDAFCEESTEPPETTTTTSETDASAVTSTDVTDDGTANVTGNATVDATGDDLANDTMIDEDGNTTKSINGTDSPFTDAENGTDVTDGATAGGPCMYEIETKQLQAFFEGTFLATNQELPHGSVLRLRCTNVNNFKFEGSHVLECKDGKWSHPKPKCISLSANSRKTAPPLWIATTPHQYYRITEEGIMVIRKNSALQITCLWSEQEPVMEVDGPIKPVDKKEFNYGKLSGWTLFFDPIQFVTVFNYTCAVPDSDPESRLSNTLTLKISDTCVLNDRVLNMHGVQVQPSKKRFLYTEGDVVNLDCVDKKIAQSFKMMTCTSNGAWVFGPTENC